MTRRQGRNPHLFLELRVQELFDRFFSLHPLITALVAFVTTDLTALVLFDHPAGMKPHLRAGFRVDAPAAKKGDLITDGFDTPHPSIVDKYSARGGLCLLFLDPFIAKAASG